ncbi:serine/threonine protein kinase [Candidatus Gottesmanbacteria bacterium]|nr:serine/threonine protein kinase [Candidatus Gottesmanbacteria bacterium]
MSAENLPQRASTLPRRMPLEFPTSGDIFVGAITGIHVLGPQIGVGGTAKVFETKDGHAVKFFKLPQSGVYPVGATPEREAALQSEFPVTAVPIVGVDSVEGRYMPFIVMELAQGTLRERINKGSLPPEEGFNILIQLARALEDIHDAGLVHRDVKPGNILFTPNGVKLTDFGIAVRQGEETMKDGTFLGSASYIAPERLSEGKETAQSDIYSWAMVAYEVLTGEKPYGSIDVFDPYEIIDAHLHRRPRPFSAVLGDRMTPLYEILERVINKAAAKDLQDRYPDMRALLVDLEEAQIQAATQVIHGQGRHPFRYKPRHAVLDESTVKLDVST